MKPSVSLPQPQQKPSLFFRMASHSHRSDSDSNPERTVRKIHRNKSWNVDQVEEINPLFPIERSHEVINNLTPSEIASNVFNFLNGQSIDAEYDDQEAVAYAQTPKGCKFRVHLFKPNGHNGTEGGNGNGNHDSSVLVEVQRRSGCCVKFHSLAMQILCAAKGCEYKPECPHFTIDTHMDLECADCDLFNSSASGANRNFVGTAY